MGRKKQAEQAPEAASQRADQGRRIVTPEEFWPLSRDYPDQAATAIYVYRLWPVIKRKPAYIAKELTLDYAWLLQRFGSGVYQLRFCDSNKRPAERFRAILKIEEAGYEPQLDLAELDLEAEKNRDYIADLRKRGELKETEEMGENTASVAVEKVVDFSREVLEREKSKQADSGPVVMIEAMKKVAEINDQAQKRALEMVPRGDGGSSDLLREFMRQNAELQKQNHDLLMKAIEAKTAAAAPAATSEFAAMERILEIEDRIAERVASRQGGNAGRGGIPWGELFRAAPALLQFLVANQMRSAQAPQPQPAPVPLPAPVVPEATPEPDGNGQQIGGFMQALQRIGPKALSAFMRGVPGDQVAAGIVAMEEDGEELYNGLVELGKDGILATLQAIPQMQAVFTARRSEIERFVDEFLSYGKDEEAEGSAQ